MSFRSLHFMNQVATILRPNLAVDVTTIRDRILVDYGTVADDVPVYLEPVGSDVVYNEQLGQIAMDLYDAYVPGGTNVMVNDVVMIDDVTYAVRGVLDFGRQGFHIKLSLARKNYHRA